VDGRTPGSFKAHDANRRITYAKGAFVLHMLRYLIRTAGAANRPFIGMMHDYLTTYRARVRLHERLSAHGTRNT